VPQITDSNAQLALLEPLGRFLELEGYDIAVGQKVRGFVAPLSVHRRAGGATIAIGSYPALIDPNDASFDHPLRRQAAAEDDVEVVLVPDYVVSRDLPTAYRLVRDEGRL
jgi:hypothetical protein